MRFLVHIGPFKTGTTSIQAALHANRALLASQGILAFHMGDQQIMDLSVRYASERKNQKSDVAELFGDADTAMRHSEACWTSLETAAPTAPFGILSSEYFCEVGDPVAFYGRIRAMAEQVTVLAYVRDPVDLFVSALQEEIKGKGAIVLQRQVGKFQVRYRDFLTAAFACVGRSNVIIRNFDRQNLQDGDVVSDFTHVARSVMPLPDLPRLSTNRALPGAAVAWLVRHENRQRTPFDRVSQRRTARRMMEFPAIAALPPLRMDSLRWETVIRRNSAPICEWLNRWHLQGQRPLRLTPDTDQPFPRRDFPSKYHWIMSYLTPEADEMITRSLSD